MQSGKESLITEPGVLLDQDLLITKIADASATVLWIGPHQEEALLSGTPKRRAIDETLLTPAIGVRPHLVFEEPADRLAKDLMILFENHPLHVTQLP
jgi:hypothetical protein